MLAREERRRGRVMPCLTGDSEEVVCALCSYKHGLAEEVASLCVLELLLRGAVEDANGLKRRVRESN